MTTIETLHADITTLDVDGIVNAANSSLLGAAEWMVRFTGQPDRSWCMNAGCCTDAGLAMQR